MTAKPWQTSAALLVSVVLMALAALVPRSVQAVPSYARQTGVDCVTCHVGGFGPYYTPYGIRFKIGGYTLSDGKEGKIPLSAMANASWTHTEKGQNPPPEHFSGNNNGTLQEASVFLAGRLTDHLGAFVQSTYSGIDRKSALDNVDIRYARPLRLGEKETIVGLSLNNNPTVQDPFNTLPAFRFPFISSALVPRFSTPFVENLAQSVIGINGYTFWDNRLYGEVGIYNSLSKTALNMINADDAGRFKGLAPYWRLAYFKDRGQDNFLIGLFGFNVDNQPDRGALGTTDRYRDIGIDAAYQYLGGRQHIFTATTSYVRERQRL
ncbi:MAG TPA: cytochrome C, partial [Rhodocyclaceae bacterium]|nr:cytochrome C [Rhodocyclaceae bacterium]